MFRTQTVTYVLNLTVTHVLNLIVTYVLNLNPNWQLTTGNWQLPGRKQGRLRYW